MNLAHHKALENELVKAKCIEKALTEYFPFYIHLNVHFNSINEKGKSKGGHKRAHFHFREKQTPFKSLK